MRDIVPFVFPRHGTLYKDYTSPGAIDSDINADEPALNCTPVLLNNGVIGLTPRPEFGAVLTNEAAASSDKGRGLFVGPTGVITYLDESSYYYSGGNQDLKATSSPGWAGNLGFFSDYQGSWVKHKHSGNNISVIVNAGHTSTHASAEHGNVWYTTDDTSAPVSVQSANMPGNNGVSLTRGGVSLNGYFFVCDINGNIHNSNINDITTWGANDFLGASRDSDVGMYLGKHHDNIVFIGTRSIEFFYDNGNASESPLARRNDIAYRTGTTYPNTVLEVGDVIYFVGVDAANSPHVYKLENFQLTILSDAKIDERIFNYNDYTLDISALSGGVQDQMYLSYMYCGQTRGLLLTILHYATYYYNFATGLWIMWEMNATPTYKGALSDWLDCFPVVSSTAGNSYQFINGTITTIGTADNTALDDLGLDNQAPIFMQTPVWDGGTLKKKRIISVRVLGDGRGTTNTRYDPTTVTLRWFDYNKKNSSTSPTPPGDYNTGRDQDINITTPAFHRLGTTRRRQWLLDWQSSHGPAAVATGLEIEYEIVE